MYYGNIKKNDIANGIGVRISLFVSGCLNKCENCFQPETWDFEYGRIFDENAEEKIIELLRPSYVDGLTVLGGEPFEPPNQNALLPFLKRIRALFPDKTIWMFTGFTLEQLRDKNCRAHCGCTSEVLGLADVLVDGAFEEKLKDLSLQFRGSSNQRIIDLNKTREAGEIVIWRE